MTDLELLDLLELVEKAQRKHKGDRGKPSVSVEKIEQYDDDSFTIHLTNGSSKKIQLFPGADGATGPQGSKGEKGDTGSPGRDGKPGADALPGRDGLPGPAGSSVDTVVVNSTGDLLLSLSTGELINCGSVVGPAGAKGATGATGLPGAPGKDGAAVLSGPRAPQESDGFDGCHWIDVSSNEFGFYKKSGDSWSKLANLRQPAKEMRVGAGAGAGGSSGSGGGGLQNTATLPLANPTRNSKSLPDTGNLKSQADYNNWLYTALEGIIAGGGGGGGIVDLSDYATIKYVDDSIAAIPSTDLSDYAKTEYVDDEIEAAGEAAEKYVDDAIAAIPPVDLSDYATEQYVDDAVEVLDDKIDNLPPHVGQYVKKVGGDTVEGELAWNPYRPGTDGDPDTGACVGLRIAARSGGDNRLLYATTGGKYAAEELSTNVEPKTQYNITNKKYVDEAVTAAVESLTEIQEADTRVLQRTADNLDFLSNAISSGYFVRNDKTLSPPPTGAAYFLQDGGAESTSFASVQNVLINKTGIGPYADFSYTRKGDYLSLQNVNDFYFGVYVVKGISDGGSYWDLDVDITSNKAFGNLVDQGKQIFVRTTRFSPAVAQDVPPTFSESGQLWYDTENNRLNVWDQEEGEFHGVGGGERGSGDYLPLTGGKLTGNLNVEAQAKVSGGSEFRVEFDDGTNFFRVIPGNASASLKGTLNTEELKSRIVDSGQKSNLELKWDGATKVYVGADKFTVQEQIKASKGLASSNLIEIARGSGNALEIKQGDNLNAQIHTDGTFQTTKTEFNSNHLVTKKYVDEAVEEGGGGGSFTPGEKVASDYSSTTVQGGFYISNGSLYCKIT